MELWKAELRLSVEEYLAGERQSEVRHEYLGGEVYAIAGASQEHNVVSMNLGTLLHFHLRGRRCRTFMTDMKVRLQIVGDEALYYPDLMVICDPRDTDRYFKRYPSVLVEVLSPDTERTDRREKLLSYLRIETLETYILVPALNLMGTAEGRRARATVGRDSSSPPAPPPLGAKPPAPKRNPVA